MNTTGKSLGNAPTALGSHDAQTSWLSGEFSDRDLEHRYRLWRYDAMLAQYKIIGWLLILAALPFLWTAYRVFGPTTAYATLALLRLTLVAVSIWILIAVYRRAAYRRLDESALSAAVLLLFTNGVTMHLSPEVGQLMIIQTLMIVTVCYVIFPGRTIEISPALILFSASFLYVVINKSDLTVTETPAIIVWLLIANSVGFLAARQFNRFRRSEFASITRAERHVAELEEARRTAEQAQAEAESANRAKSAMLASTSHELRTPLNAIIGFSELIHTELLGPIGNDRYRQYAADINGSGKHLLSLINDLLDLSKIEAGKTELHPDWLAVEDVVTEPLRLVESRAQSSAIRLKLDVHPAIASVRADERALRQILINLLTNAIKFSPDKGSVTLQGVLEQDGSVLVRVLDRGPGFEPGDVERLLQPFQQAEADPNRPREGWGLGLALVSAMCELNRIGFSLRNRQGGGAEAELRFSPDLVRRHEARPRLLASG